MSGRNRMCVGGSNEEYTHTFRDRMEWIKDDGLINQTFLLEWWLLDKQFGFFVALFFSFASYGRSGRSKNCKLILYDVNQQKKTWIKMKNISTLMNWFVSFIVVNNVMDTVHGGRELFRFNLHELWNICLYERSHVYLLFSPTYNKLNGSRNKLPMLLVGISLVQLLVFIPRFLFVLQFSSTSISFAHSNLTLTEISYMHYLLMTFTLMAIPIAYIFK